jgi:hypothetical protein
MSIEIQTYFADEKQRQSNQKFILKKSYYDFSQIGCFSGWDNSARWGNENRLAQKSGFLIDGRYLLPFLKCFFYLRLMN